MLIEFLSSHLDAYQVTLLGFLVSFIFTFIMLSLRLPFLPQDQGRAFAVNGELSKGKLRGVGIVVTICYIIVSLLFVEIKKEYLIFCLLLFAIMLSGYLDDASKIPWQDYKKGLIDLIISVLYMISFVRFNSTDIRFFGATVHLNPIVYSILGVILIWVSINVVNCTDGVDGLCGTLSIVSILAYALLFSGQLGSYGSYSLLLAASILAYLFFNTSPSSMLMGDAGSRAFGFFIAVIAMKSGHPFSFIIIALMMIIDGGLGLVKVFLLRFLKIKILVNTRTPIHDEMRKKRGWSDTQVVVRFMMFQILVILIMCLFV